MSQIQGAVIRALWAGKPKWRAKWLVQAVLGQRQRTDPVLACAVTTLQEFVRCCQRSPELMPLTQDTFTPSKSLPHSLWSRVRSAREALDVTISNSLQPREIRPLLKQLARQAAYTSVDFRTRKDFCKPAGLFDHWSTTTLLRSKQQMHLNNLSTQLRFQSVVVGCVLTNDRLAAAGWSQTSQCRFCNGAKECLDHLVHERKPLHEAIGAPVLRELGSSLPFWPDAGLYSPKRHLLSQHLIHAKLMSFGPMDPFCGANGSGSLQPVLLLSTLTCKYAPRAWSVIHV